MDTDDLTPMAYEAIVIAEEVLDELKTEIGASVSDKKGEDDFLRGVRAGGRVAPRQRLAVFK